MEPLHFRLVLSFYIVPFYRKLRKSWQQCSAGIFDLDNSSVGGRRRRGRAKTVRRFEGAIRWGICPFLVDQRGQRSPLYNIIVMLRDALLLNIFSMYQLQIDKKTAHNLILNCIFTVNIIFSKMLIGLPFNAEFQQYYSGRFHS